LLPAQQPSAHSRAKKTDVTLSIGYFVNESQWQAHDAGVLVRGLGVALNAAHIEILHAMRASFDIDFYVNVNVDVEDE
jgi:sulfur relay (sulfurtransferase) DsrC/TusE family protein